MISSIFDLQETDPMTGEAKQMSQYNVKMKFGGILNRAKADDQLHTSSLTENEFEIKVTLFQDGYLIGTSDFQTYDSQESRNFMAMINRGLVPDGLLSSVGNKSPVLTIVDKSQEVFIAAEHLHFVGQGQQIEESKAKAVEPVNLEAATWTWDQNLPTAQIQLRFHNGQKTSITVNLSHKISELYDYVRKAAPVDGEFDLLSGFPLVALKDLDKTIEELSLQGSAVTQKLI